VSILGDIRATLTSVCDHGGFEHLCRRWRPLYSEQCLDELREITAILSQWSDELERGRPVGAVRDLGVNTDHAPQAVSL